MSAEHAYLVDGLLASNVLRSDLDDHAARVARLWLAAGVDPATLELAAEWLARTAAEVGAARVTASSLLRAADWLALAPALRSWLANAVGPGAGAVELAAIAVHLVDIAERLALGVFVPELPAMTAKADRSGDAARQVGLARHLKG